MRIRYLLHSTCSSCRPPFPPLPFLPLVFFPPRPPAAASFARARAAVRLLAARFPCAVPPSESR
jgi:hypothetical protein